MSGNTFGEIFRITTFGESHGPGVGVVIDGVPAGLAIDGKFIQSELDRRRPGQSALTTRRQESDQMEILSGVFDGIATGTPLAMLIRNMDQHSADYSGIAGVFRPGHADRGFFKKYGLRDYRGGGRSSGRETAARVAAGAVAKLFLKDMGITVAAGTVEAAGIQVERRDFSIVETNPMRCPDEAAAKLMEQAVLAAAHDGDSVGGIAECVISGLPAGLGEPVFDKMDAILAQAMLSLGAVKGIEFGDGFAAARLRGSVNNLPGHAGGVQGGISTGEPVIFRVAVKPTPSVSMRQQMETLDGETVECAIKGRHDPCILPRIIPVIEAMSAIVVADFVLRNRAARI
ncbi:MAG: chorismate synthase [Victivallaceae bacterium]|nr:chorismate synthase [Victivallaceae bacterium]